MERGRVEGGDIWSEKRGGGELDNRRERKEKGERGRVEGDSGDEYEYMAMVESTRVSMWRIERDKPVNLVL